ncbi:tubby-like F-box protein 5 [Heracleum sosnowskyi]|uniref:Tubby-like F-box protein n=1 Tax=Heracleum sosnowskyi TaxID=360622 RepID=A0AAD8ISN2_9APIA|nr:tubby-like F-box protein 5 [Heracleum sosnowskyi]
MPYRCLLRSFQRIHGDPERNSRRLGERKCGTGRGRSYVAPERSLYPSTTVDQSRWANLPPELLLHIMRKIEVQATWPARRDVVSCAAVCKSWRGTTKEIVRTTEQSGLLTFPKSLKQPGPRDSPLQCFIKRNRQTSTYHLYLGLSPALAGEASKLLLTAKKIRRTTKTEFIISLIANDFSQASDAFAGKLRSNFLGTKFMVYNSQPPCVPPVESDTCLYQKLKVYKKKVSPSVAVGNLKLATIKYELNVLRTRGPRRMLCTMHTIPFASIQEGGTAPTPSAFGNSSDDESYPCSVMQEEHQDIICTDLSEKSKLTHSTGLPLNLKNKSPRWHEQLQCWCLNFKGRVTVASVKNFQLVAAVDPSQSIPSAEQEKVILQFGKIAKDIFTMDYLYPLSAFQAFAICLSSFDTKPACE